VYKTFSDIVDAIEKELKMKNYSANKVALTYDAKGFAHLKIDGEHKIKFENNLSRMLGFPDSTDWISHPGLDGKYPIDVKGGLNFLMLYSDFTENIRIGNISGKIMRVINNDLSSYGSTHVTSFHFPNIYYIPMSRRHIDCIHMTIYSDFGQIVRFAGGKTMVVLHFRRRQ